MAALQLPVAMVSVKGGRGENLRRSSSSSFHSLGKFKSSSSSSSSVSFRPKPTHWHRSARGSDLTVVMAAQASPNPMSFPSVAACLDPLFQGHHHPIIAADNKNDKKKTRWEEKEPVSPEKLEQWMRDSVGEIVKNIGEAPFLVQIFSCGDGGVRLEREAASRTRWLHIRKRWDEGSPTPDGVILVEGLRYEEEDGAASAPSTTRTWGLVAQGRGMDRAACYILNTSRVRSSVGFCTHFCMVRAKCSGEPWELQLRKAWLRGR